MMVESIWIAGERSAASRAGGHEVTYDIMDATSCIHTRHRSIVIDAFARAATAQRRLATD